MKTFVRMFQPRFAALVESGAKTQTVRPTPKRMPVAGDRISLRAWAGKPYRSKQRVLREATVMSVEKIWFNGVSIVIGDEHGTPLDWQSAQSFAMNDGFNYLTEMADWFDENHGPFPFRGIIIKWRNDE